MTDTLSPTQQESLFTVCLLAAFADGAKGDAERDAIKRIAEQLLAPDFPAATVYQRVLLGQQSLDAAVAGLDSAGLRQLAYEMAVSVCDADGATSPAEREFLVRLAPAVGLSAPQAEGVRREAEEIALAPLAAAEAAGPPAPTAPAAEAAGPPAPTAPDAKDAEADALSLKFAILNGALELLPESLATMAIIPLQMKLVYGVGRLYGVELDRGHIKEFLATAGVGLTSQVVEGVARKMLRGFLGKSIGGLGRNAVDQVASSAFSFASTYALGQVARSYYAGGRTLSPAQLRASFTPLVEQAKQLHSKYLPQIQAEASRLDVAKLLATVRGA